MANTTCLHCQKPMEPGHFGACLRHEGRLYSGHYSCVLEALGPTAALAAIRSGVLPNVADDAMIEGRLKKFVGREWDRIVESEGVQHSEGTPVAIRAVS